MLTQHAIRVLRALLASVILLWALPASAQNECQTDADGIVNGVRCLRMNGRFYGTGPGKGVEAGSILDDPAFTAVTLTESGTDHVLEFTRRSDEDPITLTLADTTDGVLTSAAWSTANQTLTLTLSTGGTVPVALSGLETAAEVSMPRSPTAIADRLTRSDLIAGDQHHAYTRHRQPRHHRRGSGGGRGRCSKRRLLG